MKNFTKNQKIISYIIIVLFSLSLIFLVLFIYKYYSYTDQIKSSTNNNNILQITIKNNKEDVKTQTLVKKYYGESLENALLDPIFKQNNIVISSGRVISINGKLDKYDGKNYWAISSEFNINCLGVVKEGISNYCGSGVSDLIINQADEYTLTWMGE